MENQELIIKIEALLFALGRPLSHAELAKQLGVPTEDISGALGKATGDRGIVLVDDGKQIMRYERYFCGS